jgi:endonuclease/exonuclease/phosphatase family metal-dependent hydrolase
MKKTFKILTIIISVILVLIIGFVLTLHLFEFRPEQVKDLEVVNEDLANKQVSLNESISILTFNTGYASLSETEDFVMDGGSKARMDSSDEVETNLNGIASILKREATDIYLLQEVDVDSSRSYNINQYKFYQEELNMTSTLAYNYRSIFVPFPLSFSQMMGKVNSGIATFSDYEITDAKRIQLPGSFPWPVRLANLKRALLITRYDISDSDQDLVVINVHLSAYDDGTMRLEEMQALQEIMAEEYNNGHYVLVGGDFNQTFPSALESFQDENNYSYKDKYQMIESDLWEAFPLDLSWFNEHPFDLYSDPLTPTCRLLHQPYDTIDLTNNQYYLIDGFIVSENIQVDLIETLDESFKYSDHNPVRIEISLIP